MKSGLTVADAFGVLFVALKLTHHIDWSWWLVLSPLLLKAFAVACIVAVETWGVR